MPDAYSMRYIKANHSKSIPRYVMSVDTETIKHDDTGKPNESSHRFRLACSMYGRVSRGGISGIERSTHTESAGFWASLYARTSARHTVWVVATKTLFDLKVLGFQGELESGNITLDSPRSPRKAANGDANETRKRVLCVIDGPPIIICCRCRLTGGRIVFVDTLNWFKLPVRDLGDAVGEKKGNLPTDTEPFEVWEAYCQQDTLITFLTFAGLMGWCVKHDMGQFVYTAAGQAYHAYRHRFMKTKIAVHHNQEVKGLERLAYFGGRTTVFKRGRIPEDVYQYDVNSLFPFVMSQYCYPNKLRRSEIRPWVSGLPDWRHPKDCAAMVRINTDKPLYPVRINRKVVYPIGTFQTALCGAELDLAVRRNEVQAVASWSEYDRADLFSRWVKDLYAMRLAYRAEGNKLYDMFTKSLLNSLYGKFGQLSPEWEFADTDCSGDPWTSWRGRNPVSGELTEFRSIGYDVFYKVDKRELASTFVAVSAFVTAAARSYMDGIREVAGGPNVVYQGVDSLIITAPGKERLEAYGTVHQDRLGSLKFVCGGNFAEIFGQQDYRIGDRIVIAGRSGYYQDRGCGVFAQHRFLNAGDMFRPNTRDQIIEKVVSWSRTQQYDSTGKVLDGWIQPVVING